MLTFISNEPRTYAWGSKDALPAILRKTPTGEPQAELWLGDHEGSPAHLAKACSEPLTLRDLISQAPEVYGVDGGSLPFLLKILGIGGPLSIQVHPNLKQARAGFEAENRAGIGFDDERRSYKDANHKPELLVALTQVRALIGFRPLNEALADIEALAQVAESRGHEGAAALFEFAEVGLGSGDDGSDDEEMVARGRMLDWLFGREAEAGGGRAEAGAGQERVQAALEAVAAGVIVNAVSAARLDLLREIVATYPKDPGVLLTLLMNITELQPGEALFVEAGILHAYLSGVAVEVMSSSDNVIRAGLTPKHIDIGKLREILELKTSQELKFRAKQEKPGLKSWEPAIKDFSLHRVQLEPDATAFEEHAEGSVSSLTLEIAAPHVMIVTRGRIRVERVVGDPQEIASVSQGQSLYISTGGTIEMSGAGEAYLATVGKQAR